jgi:hypothetical protein
VAEILELTIEQMGDELEKLTGHRYLPQIPELKTWLTPEVLREMAAPTLDEDQVKATVGLMLSAARAAFSKGYQSGARGEGPKGAESHPSVEFAPPRESLDALAVLIDTPQPDAVNDTPEARAVLARRVADASAGFAVGWRAAKDPAHVLAETERTALMLMNVSTWEG